MARKKRGTYVTKLVLENVKSFKGTHALDLCDAAGKISPWTLILGDNGVGKTTLLQCIGLLSPTVNAKDNNVTGEVDLLIEPLSAPDLDGISHFSREDAAVVELRATFVSDAFVGTEPKAGRKIFDLWAKFIRQDGRIKDIEVKDDLPSPYKTAPLFLGYGAGRHMKKGNFDPQNLPPPMHSLLEGTVELFDVEELLQYIDYATLKHKTTVAVAQFEMLKKMVSELLPDVGDAGRITIHGATAFGFPNALALR